MHKHFACGLFAALCVTAAPSYAANDQWQFTVTSDQNGPNTTCNEEESIPCTITGHLAPYILGTVTISAPLATYLTGPTLPITVAFDDNHLVSIVGSAAIGLSGLDWPQTPTYPLIANVSLNEVAGKLSGYIYLELDEPRFEQRLVMTGMNNLWTGFWLTEHGPVHQFWARSDKI